MCELARNPLPRRDRLTIADSFLDSNSHEESCPGTLARREETSNLPPVKSRYQCETLPRESQLGIARVNAWVLGQFELVFAKSSSPTISSTDHL